MLHSLFNSFGQRLVSRFLFLFSVMVWDVRYLDHKYDFVVFLKFNVSLIFQITTMPGLPTRPALYDIDLNTDTGEIDGLF